MPVRHKYMMLFVFMLFPLFIFSSCTGCGDAKSANSSGGPKAIIPIQEGAPPSADQDSNIKQRIISGAANLFAPKSDTRLTLYVSNTANKPPSTVFGLNIYNGSFYTPVSGGVFVDKDVSTVRWFYYKFKSTPETGMNLVWQVARHPFSPREGGNWKRPRGLVKTATIPASSEGEFTIDFRENTIVIPPTIGARIAKPITSPHQAYYARIFPVDTSGNPVGDPGEGLTIICGKQISDPFVAGGSPGSPSFKIWTPFRIMGSSTQSSEFPCNDYPELRLEVYVEPKDAPIMYSNGNVVSRVSHSSRLFSIVDLDPDVYRIIFQVSDIEFRESSVWNNTKKVIFEKSFNLPIRIEDLNLPAGYTINNEPGISEGYFSGVPLVPSNLDNRDYVTKNCKKSILIDFNEFAKKYTEMTEDRGINYYVRAIALKNSSHIGTSVAYYSNTVKIKYIWKKTSSYTFPPMPPVPPEDRIHVVIPEVRIKSYTPIKWEDFNYMNHHVVFRAPLWNEIDHKFIDQDGKVLLPYLLGKAMGVYTMTEVEYEENIIPQFFSMGRKIYFPPPAPEQKDESFWGELWSLVSGFFNNIVDAFSSIYTAVQTAYQNIRDNLIAFVVQILPDGTLKNAFTSSLNMLVDAGMIAAGVPPTLPNFDQLIKGNMEYLAEVALTEAGVPAADITAELVGEIASEMQDQIDEATYHSDPNPVNAPYLKLDPDYLYRPAYVEVEVKNPSTIYPSAPGTFDINTAFKFGYEDVSSGSYSTGISLGEYLPGGSWLDGGTPAYRDHFYKGLNGNTCDLRDIANSGNKVTYDIFNPVIAFKFPILKPGETKTIRIYLTEYRGVMTKYPQGECQRMEDFYNIYNNGYKQQNQATRSHFYLHTTIVSPEEHIDKQNLQYTPSTPDARPVYFNSYSFPSLFQDYNEPTITSWIR